MTAQYFDPAQPVGDTKRFLHEGCSEGKDPALSVTKTTTGWLYDCFRCGWKGFRPLKGLPPEQIKEHMGSVLRKDKPKQCVKEIKLPHDYTREIPAEGLSWLWKYGITDTEVFNFKIGYSQYYNRVILPVYNQDRLVYWQGRYLGVPDAKNSKYLNVSQSGRQDIYFFADYQTTSISTDIVIVEDILSAIKVSRIVDAVALLNSFIPDTLLLNLISRKVHIWLDEDKKFEALKYLNRFSTIGVETRLIFTDKDPKEYTTEQIINKIK